MIVRNVKDTVNVSFGIRIQTNELGATEKETKKLRTNLDFIFKGPNSEQICNRIKQILTNQSLN